MCRIIRGQQNGGGDYLLQMQMDGMWRNPCYDLLGFLYSFHKTFDPRFDELASYLADTRRGWFIPWKQHIALKEADRFM